MNSTTSTKESELTAPGSLAARLQVLDEVSNIFLDGNM